MAICRVLCSDVRADDLRPVHRGGGCAWGRRRTESRRFARRSNNCTPTRPASTASALARRVCTKFDLPLQEGRFGLAGWVYEPYGQLASTRSARAGRIRGIDQEQLTHPRRLRAGRRVGDQLRELDPAGGKLSLQPRTGAWRSSFAFARARAPVARGERPGLWACGCHPARGRFYESPSPGRGEENQPERTVSKWRFG
jgi:hypothetical protein